MLDDKSIIANADSTSTTHPEPGLQIDNAFWQFSLKVYAGEDVATECLTLQESHRIDVNVLLWCAWTGRHGIALTDGDVAAAKAAVESWHDAVVRPLRRTRQGMKRLGTAEFEPLRARVKELEIDAEQIEQALLFRATPAGPKSEARAPANLIASNIARYLGAHDAPRLTAATLALDK